MTSSHRVHWTERLTLRVAEVAELLDMSRRSVHRLVQDWAFGDPARLPSTGSSVPHLRIPSARVLAYVQGDREYPPGDPRTAALPAAEPERIC